MFEVLFYIFFLTWTGLAILGFKRPGYHAVLVFGFLVAEEIYAHRFPGLYLSNRKLPDFVTGIIALTGLIWNGNLSIKNLPTPVWLSMAIFGFTGMSVYWSLSPEFSEEQYWKIFPLTILAGIIGPLSIRSKSDIFDFVYGYLALSSIACLIFALGEKKGRSLALMSELGTLELQPLAPAQMGGYVVLLSSVLLFKSPVRKIRGLFLVSLILLGLYVIASTSSRGQVVAVFPILILWVPWAVSLRGLSLKSMAAICSAFAAGLATYWIIENFNFGSRWNQRSMDSGTEFRLEMILVLFDAYINSDIATWIMGLGSGSSYSIMNAYCHNVVVEILCEIGIVGLLMYVIYTWTSFFQGIRMTWLLKGNELHLPLAGIVAMTFYDFLMSLKQGTLLAGDTFLCLNLLAMATLAARNAKTGIQAAPDLPHIPPNMHRTEIAMVSAN